LALDHSAAGNTAQGLLQRSNQDGKHAKSGLVANPKETARIWFGSTPARTKLMWRAGS
jgi:hypothetical protein